MEVYGLTGGIGSGKSTVAEMLEEYGIPVVSADELSRMVVAPGSRGLNDVVEAFGSEVLDDKGELDRKKMGGIVFTTPERRRQLEAILHPRIRERYEQVLDALEKGGHRVMLYEVPLLFEKKLDQQDEMKGVILVTATTDTRIARVKSRDTLTTDDVLARMRAQMPEQEKRARADYIIHNDGDLDDLRREVEHLISRFLRIAPRSATPEPELNALDTVLELEPEADPAMELDDSEVELSPDEVELAPDEIDDGPTEQIDLREPSAPRLAAPSGIATPELEVLISSPSQSGSRPELEAELTRPVPTGVASFPSAFPSVSPPPASVTMVSTSPPNEGPIVPLVPSLATPGPRPSRTRTATAPQKVVPLVDDGGEESKP